MAKYFSFIAISLLVLPSTVFATTVDSHYLWDYGTLQPAGSLLDHPVVNSSQGITQLAIDMSGLTAPSSLSASDFSFHVGNSSDPTNWSVLATPVINVATGAGVGGSDRVTFDWSGVVGITDTWIEVATLPTVNSGLASPDYFYAGSMVGDVNGDATVSPIDSLMIINSLNALGNHPATANDPKDINRDGLISPIDSLIIINKLNAPGSTLQLQTFTPQVPPTVPLPSSIWLFISGVIVLTSKARVLRS
jgi:hypothetical protein